MHQQRKKRPAPRIKTGIKAGVYATITVAAGLGSGVVNEQSSEA
jgi:hypothetical protein